ncbi:MAG: hypothetical protein AB7P17_04385 [Nitrospirales bacterium]
MNPHLFGIGVALSSQCVRTSRVTIIRSCILIAIFGFMILSPNMTNATFGFTSDKSIGIQPLQDLKGASLSSIVPASSRPLLTAPELEAYLRQLEGTQPPWDQLSSHDMTEQSERLFQFNRSRDEIREHKHALLQQPIAFVWGGELRQFHEEHQGYTVALGPEIIHTAWGLIRFKPRDIPDNMMAKIPPERKAAILDKLDNLETKEIGVLFMGTLVESESIMYAFSHDGDHEGMILPVVNITALKYYLK